MAEITATIPNAWITEDNVVLMAAGVHATMLGVFEAGNAALEECGYAERIGWQNFRPPYPVVWVDPAYVAAEQWPESVVSEHAVDGWVRLFRVDIEQLGAPDDHQ